MILINWFLIEFRIILQLYVFNSILWMNLMIMMYLMIILASGGFNL